MVCWNQQPAETFSSSLSNEDLFRKAFADRFASLDSLVSSSSDGGGCAPCSALLKQPADLHASRPASGTPWLQWMLFVALLVVLLLLILYIVRTMRAAGPPRHHRHHHPPSPVYGAHAALGVGDALKTSVTAGSEKKGAVQDILTPSHMKKANGSKPLVVFLHATWCGHCKTTMPIFEQLAAQYADKADFKRAESEILSNDPTLKELGVNLSGFPTTIILIGGKLVETKVGGFKKEDFAALLDKVLAS